MDAPISSHMLQGQALLAGSLSVGGRVTSVSVTNPCRDPPHPYPSSSPLSLLYKVEAGHPSGLAWPRHEVLRQGGLQPSQFLRAQFLGKQQKRPCKAASQLTVAQTSSPRRATPPETWGWK